MLRYIRPTARVLRGIVILTCLALVVMARPAGVEALPTRALHLVDDVTSCSVDPAVPTAVIPTGNSQQVACVADQMRQVRGSLSDCPTDDRALEPGAPYVVGDCKGTSTRQAEAIAQARLVAHLNAAKGGPANAISQDVEWEVGASRIDAQSKITPNSRVDVLAYQSQDPTSPINVIELKVGKPGNAQEIAAAGQAQDYVRGLRYDGVGSHPVQLEPFSTPYLDTFTLQQKDCEEDPQYYDAVSTQPGVVMVYRVNPPGEGDAGDPFDDATQELEDGENDIDCPLRVAPRVVPPLTIPEEEGGEESPSITCGLSAEEAFDMTSSFGYSLIDSGLVTDAEAEANVAGDEAYVKQLIRNGQIARADAALASACSVQSGGTGGGFGDPHLSSLDGMAFDMQSVGEFDLVNAPDLNLDLQARFVPYHGSSAVSVMDRIAFTLNGFRIEMDSDDDLWVNGQLTDLPGNQILYFNGGAQIIHRDGEYQVLFPNANGHTGALDWQPNSLQVQIPQDTPTTGLLGNNDGDPSNDLVTKDGVAPPDLLSNLPGWIHGQFARSWRITDSESLFTYASGDDTSTYTDADFPSGAVSESDFPADEVADARDACADAALGSAQQGCVLDYLETGSSQFVDDALKSQSALVSAAPAVLSDATPSIGVNFDDTVPLNMLPTQNGSDTSIGSFAGPYKSEESYKFAVPVEASSTGLTFATDLIVLGDLTQSRQRSVSVQLGQELTDTINLNSAGAEADQGTITPLDTGTLSDGRHYARYRYSVTLPPVTTSLNGMMTVSGFSRYQNDSVGFDNVSLSLTEEAAPDVRTIAIGDTVQPNQDGTEGTLQSEGDIDSYEFTVPADAPPLSVDQIAGPTTPLGCDNWQLVDEDTSRVSTGCFDDERLSAGTYRLDVAAPDGSTFPRGYAFQLHEPFTSQDFDTDVSSTPVSYAPSDGTGAGVLPGFGGDDIYHLNVTEAGELLIKISCPDGDTKCVQYADLEDQSNGTFTRNQAAVDVHTGSYSLQLDSGAGEHHYNLTLQVVEPTSQSISLGQVIKPAGDSDEGTITADDPRDRYTFNVPTGGEMVYLKTLPDYPAYVATDPSAPWDLLRTCSFWQIHADNGRAYDGCLGTFLDAGTYTLDILAPPGQPMSFHYGFELLGASDVHSQTFDHALVGYTPLQIDPDSDTGEGVLENTSSTDVEVIHPDATGKLQAEITCDDSVCPEVEDLEQVYDGWTSWMDPSQSVLQAGATYQVTIGGGEGGSHSYHLSLGVKQPTDYTIGSTENGSWGAQGDTDLYQFTVPAGGQDVGVQLSNNLGPWEMTLTDAATGNEVDGWTSLAGGALHLDAGTYQLQVRSENYPFADNYSFRLFDAPQPESSELSVGAANDESSTSDSLVNNAATHQYTFTIADAGNYTFSISGDVDMEFLETPSGDTGIDGGANQVYLDAGSYTVVVQADGDGFGAIPYTLGLNASRPVDEVTYHIGDLVTHDSAGGVGRLSDRSDVDQYDFDVPDGGEDLSILFDGLPDACDQVTITDDDGNGVPVDCSFEGWSDHFDAGHYTLTVAEGYQDLGAINYTMRIVPPSTGSSSTVTIGRSSAGDIQQIDGTIGDDATVNTYTFTLTQQDLDLDPWLEIDPGSNCASFSLYEGDDYVGGGACQTWVGWMDPGTYTMQVTGHADQPYHYAVFETNHPDPSGGGGGGE